MYFYTFSHRQQGREGKGGIGKSNPSFPKISLRLRPWEIFFGPQKISRASGMDFPSFGGALVHSHPPLPPPPTNCKLLPQLWSFEFCSKFWILVRSWNLVKILKTGQTLEIWSNFGNLVTILKFGQNYEIYEILKFGWNSENW